MSTRITILAFGTRGDVGPMTGLAAGLADHLGATVAIAAQRPYESMITGSGFEYRHLPRDTEADTRASTYGQAMVDGRRLKPSKEALEGMREDLRGVGEAMAVAAEDADLILCGGPVGTMLGWHVAEASGRPSAAVVLQPSYPTGNFAPPPLGTRSYGRWGNRAAWNLAAAGEKFFAPLIDDLRRTLGLPAQSVGARRRLQRRWTQLCGFSSHVVPTPRDWPAHVHTTGYWWPVDSSAAKPSAELLDFLDDGPPPVFVGLGSTAISNGEEISTIVADALRHTGRRGVVQRGWARLDGGNDTTTLHTIDDVSHAWLFPRTAGVVHHCGAGTTASTLRSATPSIALPGIMDQPFWAHRLQQLGCSPRPIPRSTLTAGQLSEAITEAVDDGRYRHAATELSAKLSSEDGPLAAARVVEALL
ncbi:glycosyltransferase [Gordonia terrae]|uniref:Glycosyltransferase n=1 Tax=Gordonia terrae TaxID=2055 RepID=A0A2I1R6V7_9ACTN|nr:glycosyltransferase [Gordonia terrae]PKZ64833.1 glycosyltransferase [Gordonia terrae]